MIAWAEILLFALGHAGIAVTQLNSFPPLPPTLFPRLVPSNFRENLLSATHQHQDEVIHRQQPTFTMKCVWLRGNSSLFGHSPGQRGWVEIKWAPMNQHLFDVMRPCLCLKQCAEFFFKFPDLTGLDICWISRFWWDLKMLLPQCSVSTYRFAQRGPSHVSHC